MDGIGQSELKCRRIFSSDKKKNMNITKPLRMNGYVFCKVAKWPNKF